MTMKPLDLMYELVRTISRISAALLLFAALFLFKSILDHVYTEPSYAAAAGAMFALCVIASLTLFALFPDRN